MQDKDIKAKNPQYNLKSKQTHLFEWNEGI
jgi:hypothetical protein